MAKLVELPLLAGGTVAVNPTKVVAVTPGYREGKKEKKEDVAKASAAKPTTVLLPNGIGYRVPLSYEQVLKLLD